MDANSKSNQVQGGLLCEYYMHFTTRQVGLTESYIDFCYPVLMQEQPDISSSFQAKQKLEGLLNKNMRIRMTDGRTLVGLFLCTDRDCNVILGSAQEFLKSTGGINTSVWSSIYKI